MPEAKDAEESSCGEAQHVNQKSIFGTAVTLDYIEKRLTESLKTTSKFGMDLKMSRLGAGQGFLSVIARIEPNWTPDDPSLPRSFIVKIATLETFKQTIEDEQVSKTFQDTTEGPDDFIVKLHSILYRAHKAEVTFYEFAQKHAMNAKIPRIYFSEDFSDTCKQGLLIMEDKDDAVTLMMYDNLNPTEVKKVLSALAEVHSFALGHPESLDIGSQLYVDMMSNYDTVQIFHTNLKLVQSIDEKTLAPLCKELTKHVDVLTDPTVFINLHKELDMPPMMIHGDFWPANVLFTNVDGEKQVVAIIDWQMVHKGCAAEDLARFILSSMSPKDRREHIDDLLQHYYDELQKHLERVPPFSFDQLKKSFKRLQPITLAILLPICGPFIQKQIQDIHPERKEELMEVVRQKAIGYAEDALHYLKLNEAE